MYTFTFINPLMPRLTKIICKPSDLTANKTQRIFTASVNWLMLIREITAVYSDDHMKPVNSKMTVFMTVRRTIA